MMHVSYGDDDPLLTQTTKIWAGSNVRPPDTVSATGEILIHDYLFVKPLIIKCLSLQNPSTDLAEIWPQLL